MSDIGGMWNLLPKLAEIQSRNGGTFSKKDIEEIVDLCSKSITNNLSRLVKAGMLKRHSFHIGNKGRFVAYFLTEDALLFLKSLGGVEDDSNKRKKDE